MINILFVCHFVREFYCVDKFDNLKPERYNHGTNQSKEA